MSDCCLIKKVATVEVYENKNEVRAYGFMAGDKNTPMMEVKFKHLWGEENLSKCKLRWIIVDDMGSLLVGEVPISAENKATIELPNELFNGERRMKVQLTVASCDGSRILNLQQFTDLKVINNLATNEVVEPVYQMLINQVYDDTKKYLAELETSYKAKYGSLESVYAKSKASLEQYLITAENGGNAEFLQGYSPVNFIRSENTINELVNSATGKYKIGDIVYLNGYYTAGDGAHHERKIESADDGSGVQLANGLWANIVHNGEVNVSWFGAKGDGVTDDTLAIVKCHKKAFRDRAKVIYQRRAKYILKNQETLFVNNSINFNDSTIVIDEKINNLKDKLFVVKSDENFSAKDVSSLSLSTTAEQNVLGDLDGVPENCLVILDSDYVEENNKPGYDAIYVDGVTITKNPDISVLGKKGWLKNGIFNDIAKVKKVYFRNLDAYTTTLEGLTLELSGDNNVFMATYIHTQRDNTVIRDLAIKRKYTELCKRRNLLKATCCVNTTLKNVISTEPYTAPSGTGEYEGYIFRADLVAGLTFEDIQAFDNQVRRAENNTTVETGEVGVGWYFMGNQFVNGMRVKNCKFSRIDSHSHLKDLMVENSEIGFAQGIFVGTTTFNSVKFTSKQGVVKNLLINYSNNTPSRNTNIRGELNIRDCTYYTDTDYISGLLHVGFDTTNTICSFEKINISNFHVKKGSVQKELFIGSLGYNETVININNSNITFRESAWNNGDANLKECKKHNIRMTNARIDLSVPDSTRVSTAKKIILDEVYIMSSGYVHAKTRGVLAKTLVFDKDINPQWEGLIKTVAFAYGYATKVLNDGVLCNASSLINYKNKDIDILNFGDVFIHDNEVCTCIKNNFKLTSESSKGNDFISKTTPYSSWFFHDEQNVIKCNEFLGIEKFRFSLGDFNNLEVTFSLDGTLLVGNHKKEYVYASPFSTSNRSFDTHIFKSDSDGIITISSISALNGFVVNSNMMSEKTVYLLKTLRCGSLAPVTPI
ncbi:MAG: hypothetical protein ACRCX2_28705 [Paraclostridium sp.]